MQEKELEIRFEEAVAIANTMTQLSLPQDVQLRLYALYKQATFGTIDKRTSPDYNNIRNAFKLNAWRQISHLSIEKAKEEYIEMIHSVANKK